VSIFFANTAILIAGLAAGFAGSQQTTCEGEAEGCTDEDKLLFVKIGVLVGCMLAIFFIFTQCTRFMNHFSFMINTRYVDGIELPKTLIATYFIHSHRFYSVGIRMYFLTIPIFAWIFGQWVLVGVTPLYLLLIHSLESSKFMDNELQSFEQSIADYKSNLKVEEQKGETASENVATKTA